jgi:hypothetical protein
VQPNIFSRAWQLGINSAAIEWFHPACRALSGLAYCEFWPMSPQSNRMATSFAQLVPGQARSLFETSLFSLFGQSLAVRAHVETYHAILASALGATTNPRYGLTFVHKPIPHAPHGYNCRTGRFDLANSPIHGYVDSLALVDHALGQIRRAMESAGLAGPDHRSVQLRPPVSRSAIIRWQNSSSHSLSPEVPGQHTGAVYSRPFNWF